MVGPSPLPSKEDMPAQTHCCGALQARHRTQERQLIPQASSFLTHKMRLER